MTGPAAKSPAGADLPSVAVVILNWNSWADTLECLESVLRLDYPNASVIVCDNASTDGSEKRFRQWVQGELSVIPARPEMSHHAVPPVPKPVSYQIVDPSTRLEKDRSNLAAITFFQNGANVGFAAGNNVGLSYALAQGFQYCWVLNADTGLLALFAR